MSKTVRPMLLVTRTVAYRWKNSNARATGCVCKLGLSNDERNISNYP